MSSQATPAAAAQPPSPSPTAQYGTDGAIAGTSRNEPNPGPTLPPSLLDLQSGASGWSNTSLGPRCLSPRCLSPSLSPCASQTGPCKRPERLKQACTLPPRDLAPCCVPHPRKCRQARPPAVAGLVSSKVRQLHVLSNVSTGRAYPPATTLSCCS